MPRKGGLFLQITPDKGNKDVLRMLEINWKKRFEKLKSQVVYRAAASSLEAIKRKVPATADNKQYLDSLEVVRITGLPPESVGYAIRGKPKKTRGGALALDGTILYVQARRSLKRLLPEVAVLIRHSPWTLESIPFVPKKSDATLIYRKVSARTVEKVAKSRKKDRRVWQQALSRKRIKPKASKSRWNAGNSNLKAISDPAFTALNMEFGYGGVKARPHWRIAASDLKRKELRNMMKGKDLGQAISDPTSKKWLTWPKKTQKSISATMAQTFVPFQKKLGIKFQT
jgi:hypothetical protein